MGLVLAALACWHLCNRICILFGHLWKYFVLYRAYFSRIKINYSKSSRSEARALPSSTLFWGFCRAAMKHSEAAIASSSSRCATVRRSAGEESPKIWKSLSFSLFISWTDSSNKSRNWRLRWRLFLACWRLRSLITRTRIETYYEGVVSFVTIALSAPEFNGHFALIGLTVWHLPFHWGQPSSNLVIRNLCRKFASFERS